jgi:hypothetical protein
MDKRAVVTRPFPESGLGSNLMSLAGAVWLAGRLRRCVVVDWRGMVDLKDPSLDYFLEFFEPLQAVHGVRIEHSLLESGYMTASSENDVRFMSPNEAASIGRSRADSRERYLGLQAYHGLDRINGGFTNEQLRERHRFLKTFYTSITPRRELRAEIDDWYTEHLLGSFVIGVNIRTGNGGSAFTKGGAYAERFDQSVLHRRQFLKRVGKACDDRLRRLPRFLRSGHRQIVVVTDSAWMQALLTRLPGAVSRRKVFPPFGVDHQFADWDERSAYTDRDSISDTIVDMFLLARTNALVYNNTNFNRYALTMTDYFSGNEANIEEYFLRARFRQAHGLVRRGVTRLPAAT